MCPTKRKLLANLLHFIFLVAPSNGQLPPTILSSPLITNNELNCLVSTIVKLQCTAIGDSPITYYWKKDGNRITSSENNGTLFINLKAGSHSTGRYQCCASNPFGTATSKGQDLYEIPDTVFISQEEVNKMIFTCNKVPPKFKSHVKWGSTKELFSRMDGSSSALCTEEEISRFEKESKFINPGRIVDQEGSLILLDEATASMSQSHFCAVPLPQCKLKGQPMYKLHSIYSYIKAVTLRVNQPVILGGGEIVQAAVGEDAKLFCIPIMNGEKPVISWTHSDKDTTNNGKMSLENSNMTLIISDVTSHEAGIYECFATLSNATISKKIQLVVGSPPRFKKKPTNSLAKIGDDLTLSCSGDGDPPPKYEWTFDGDVINNRNNGSLIIPNFSRMTIGKYGCNISNEFGYDYAEASVKPSNLIQDGPVKEIHSPGVPTKFLLGLGATGVVMIGAVLLIYKGWSLHRKNTQLYPTVAYTPPADTEDPSDADNRPNKSPPIGPTSPWKSNPSLIPLRRVGRGAYGTVYQAKDLSDIHNPGGYVIKCVNILHHPFHCISTEDILSNLLNEIIILSKLNCDHVVRYFGCWAEAEDCSQLQLSKARLESYLIALSEQQVSASSTAIALCPISSIFIKMEYCDFSLKEFLDKDFVEGGRNDAEIMNQIAKGMRYIHEKGFIHRDLKPGNILATRGSEDVGLIWKIADFGLATEAKASGHERTVGTKEYRSPEMSEGLSYSTKSDVYSLGLVFLEIIRRFGTSFERNEIFSKICKCSTEERLLKIMEVTKGETPGLAGLVGKMLDSDPSIRISSDDICTFLQNH